MKQTLKDDIHCALQTVKEEYGDTLATLGDKTIKEIDDRLSSNLDFSDDWDNIYWHAGYIEGLRRAKSLMM